MILVVAAFNANQALGKPYNQQQLDGGTDYGFPDANIARNQFVKKSVVRQNVISKGGYLKEYCSLPKEGGLQNQSRQSSCEAGWYPCFGLAEMVCKTHSLACLTGLKKYGFPKCAPVYTWTTIDLGFKRTTVRRTAACRCA